MATNVRLPFDTMLSSRDTTLDKDAITTNVFVDSTSNDQMLVKRPGMENLTSALGLGINGALGYGQGIFYYEDKLYSFNSIDPGNQWAGWASTGTKAFLISGNPGPGTKFLSLDTDGNIEVTEDLSEGGDGDYSSIVYTGTKLIALGTFTGDNFIFTSADNGVTWINEETLSSNITTGVGAVKGSTICFITDTANYVITSTDNGVSWTETNLAKGSSNNNAIAVLGANFTIGSYYSANGTTWTVCTGAASAMDELVSNGSYILGFSSFTDDLKFSNNGIFWSNVSKTGSGASKLARGTRLAWNGTKWCGVTPDGSSVTSTNGSTWTLGNRSQSLYVIPDKMIYFDGAFYCLSQTPSGTTGNPFNLSFLEKSTDGINWQTSIIDVALFDENPTIISGLS